MPKNSEQEFLGLADELLLAILHYLDAHTLFQVAYVCIKLRALVFDHSLESKWGLHVKKHINAGSKITGLFLKDDCSVVYGSKDGLVGIWNWVTGEMEQEFSPKTNPIHYFAQTESGKLACSSGKKDVSLLDLTNIQSSWLLKGCGNCITSLFTFGEKIIAGTEHGDVLIWDDGVTECQHVQRNCCITIGIAAIKTELIVCGFWYGDFIIFDPETKQTIFAFNKCRYTVPMSCLLTTSQGHIVTAFNDGLLRIFEPETYGCNHEIQAHDSRINCLLSTEVNNIITGSVDGSIRMWDINTAECKIIMSGHKKSVVKLKALNKTHIVSTSADKTLRIWNLITGECEYTQAIINLWPFCLDVNRNGTVLCGSTDGSITQLKYSPRPELVIAPRTILDIVEEENDKTDLGNVNRHSCGITFS